MNRREFLKKTGSALAAAAAPVVALAATSEEGGILTADDIQYAAEMASPGFQFGKVGKIKSIFIKVGDEHETFDIEGIPVKEGDRILVSL